MSEDDMVEPPPLTEAMLCNVLYGGQGKDVLFHVKEAAKELEKVTMIDARKKKLIREWLSAASESLQSLEDGRPPGTEHQCRGEEEEGRCRFLLCPTTSSREGSWKYHVVAHLRGSCVTGTDSAGTLHRGVRVSGARVIFCRTCNFLRTPIAWLCTLKNAQTMRPSTITYALFGPEGRSVAVKSNGGREMYRIFHAGHAAVSDGQLRTCPFMYDD